MWPTQFMSKAFRRISFVISQFPGLGGCTQCSRLGTGGNTELQRAVRARGYVFWRRLTIFQRARPYRGARRQTVLRGKGAAFGDQEAIGGGTERGMVVEAAPPAPFVRSSPR